MAHLIQRWLWRSVEGRFERVQLQAQDLAIRLFKEEPRVEIDHGDHFEEPSHFSAFWSVFSHVVRNAIDHGFEPQPQRQLSGNPHPCLRLQSRLEGADWVVSAQDNGAGINWEALRVVAQSRGLPHLTQAHLRAALFSHGVSTAATITEISGRGVGMAAVANVVSSLGGVVEVESEAGKGTTFTFRFPAQGHVVELPPPGGLGAV